METIEDIRHKIEVSKQRVCFIEQNPQVLTAKAPLSQLVSPSDPLGFTRRDIKFPASAGIKPLAFDREKLPELEEEKPQAQKIVFKKPQIRATQKLKAAPTVKVSKTKSHSLVPAHDIEAEKSVKALGAFFTKNLCISMQNFSQAKKLFASLFIKPEKYKNSYLLLAQELDKRTSKCHNLGKVHLSMVRPGQLLLERLTKSSTIKQYITIDSLGQDIAVYTVFTSKSAKSCMREFIRSTKFEANADTNSVEFDANIWKQANASGISLNGVQRTLDCYERNHLHISKFIATINKKDIGNILLPTIIQEQKIKTNAKDTTFTSFKAKNGQKVSLKLAKSVSSLRLE